MIDAPPLAESVASVAGAESAPASTTLPGLRSTQKPSALRTPPSSSGEQPRTDIISGVTVKPPSPVAPFGGLESFSSEFARQDRSGRIRSARRSSMSRRTAREPQT